MRINQKIMFLYIDYVMHVIVSRDMPELAALPKIREYPQLKQIRTRLGSSHSFDDYYMLALIAANNTLLPRIPASFKMQFCTTSIKYNVLSCGSNITHLRALLDQAINPDQYW